MSRIESCSVRYLTRPHTVLTTSYGAEKQEKSHAFVVLKDANGNIGFGEATPLSSFSGETSRLVQLILESKLLPLLLGRDSFDIAAAHEIMDRAIAGNCAAKSAIDCAMYDLSAKSLGIPLYRLLGGKFRERVPINRHIGITTPEAAADMAKQYVSLGFQSIKMKVGNCIEKDAASIRAVREAIGPEVKIRIDANCGMTYPQACKLIHMVKDCDLEYYEQLLPKWDLSEMRQLRWESGVPMLADEAVNSVREAAEYAVSGAADAVTIKLCKCGGIYPAMQIAGVAAGAGMSVVVASTYDTHIGCAACLHLASALPNVLTACDLTTFATQPNFAETCHTLNGMYLSAGDAPGIGVYSMFDLPNIYPLPSE